MLRPIKIDKAFDLALDTLTCLWGGLVAPRLCEQELKAKLAPFPHLISFASSISPEDAHLSKESYFAICASDDRTKEVGNHACCLVALFAHESFKNHSRYSALKNRAPVAFLRHLRNGSAHGNTFDFTYRNKLIDPGRVEWKGKIINKNLQGEKVFPDFFAQGDFAFLFEDITKLIQ